MLPFGRYDLAATPPVYVVIDNNSLFSPKKGAFDNGQCGGKEITDFAAWQESGLGYDKHSSLATLGQFTTEDHVTMARSLLGLGPAQHW